MWNEIILLVLYFLEDKGLKKIGGGYEKIRNYYIGKVNFYIYWLLN